MWRRGAETNWLVHLDGGAGELAVVEARVGAVTAEQLAGTEHSVTRIAMDVGYSSLSAFQSAFRELIGQTPTEYRAGFAP